MPVKQQTTRRAYAGMSAEERDASRRSALIEAGLASFGTRGYAQTTIESLCQDASISTRDFYHCFASKEELLLAVYDRLIEQTMSSVIGAVAAALSDAAEPRAVIRAGIEAFAGSMTEDERAARINFIEVVGVSPAVESRRRVVIADFARFVGSINETLTDRGELDHTTLSPVHSVAMVGAIHETLTDWMLQPERPPLDATVDALVDIFAAVLRS